MKRISIPRLFALIALSSTLGVLSPRPLAAATFTVTRFDDPAPDGCIATDCSLREAVIAANKETGSSKPKEPPLQLLTEPYVKLSLHTALPVRHTE